MRTIPASSYNPHYNEKPLTTFLKQNGIAYLHLPAEFGARHTDPNLLDADGKVDFGKVRKSPAFRKGINRIFQGLEKGFAISLMCSEGDPFDCHRFAMISVALENEGLEMAHIMKDKSLKTNADLEAQLLAKYDRKLPKPDMFNPTVSREDQLAEAYRLRNKEIGFSPSSKTEQTEVL